MSGSRWHTARPPLGPAVPTQARPDWLCRLMAPARAIPTAIRWVSRGTSETVELPEVRSRRIPTTAPAISRSRSRSAVVTDVLQRSAQASVVVTRDSQPPTVDVATPQSVSHGQPGQVVAVVTDENGIASLVFRVNGMVAPSPTVAPFMISLVAPD